MTTTIAYPDNVPPTAFTQAELGWTPWLAPLTEADLTDRHRAGLVDASRAKSTYFMLLAHDPEVLEARTKADKDIFYNPNGGLPRAERELAATATSRHNGCIFCASVHSRFASTHSRRRDDVQLLLNEGLGAEIGERWNAVKDAAVALTDTPARFGGAEIAALRAAGLDDYEITDVVSASAFFNWANRLMLSLGEPTPAQTA